jgi:DNA primase
VGSQDIAIRYELGFVAEPLPGDEYLQGAISIPYLSPSGPVGMKFRVLTAGDGKYIKHKGEQNRLYNTQAYFSAGHTIGISEGEMDAIAATEHLGIPTLGVPGVKSWKDSWKHLLKDFTTVFIFADGDQPGRNFAAEMAERVGWRGRIVRCPDGEDVSSMAASGRTAELTSLMSTSNDEDEA